MIAVRQRKARNFCAKEIQVTRAACRDGGAWLKVRSGHLVDGGKRQGGGGDLSRPTNANH